MDANCNKLAYGKSSTDRYMQCALLLDLLLASESKSAAMKQPYSFSGITVFSFELRLPCFVVHFVFEMAGRCQDIVIPEPRASSTGCYVYQFLEEASSAAFLQNQYVSLYMLFEYFLTHNTL